MKLSTSILSIVEDKINQVHVLATTDTDYLHLDIMDGDFVTNKTDDNDVFSLITPSIQIPLDIHFMVTDVKKYIERYEFLQPVYMTFHVEAVKDVFDMISFIKQKGIKAGISIKPDTAIDEIIPYLPILDLVLVMSVEPGMGGQAFLDSSVSKIEMLSELKKANNYHYEIEVDGGINLETAKKCIHADILVAGSYITNDGCYQENMNALRASL